jgi:NAD+ kinase
MKRVGLIVNRGKARAADALLQVVRLAEAAGLAVVVDERFGPLQPGLTALPTEKFAGAVEGVVVLGGDGTMLDAAHRLRGTGLPLMGLNLGSLGYLTSVEESQFGAALACLRQDRFVVEQLAGLSGEIRRANGATVALPDALNDVVVRGTSGRLAWLELLLDGLAVTTYACDGIIVATPTGSTAYSLAAGGPIIMPGTRALAIGMICPHTLTSRPLVVSDSSAVAIRVTRNESAVPLLVSVDGRDGIVLAANEQVCVRRSPCDVPVIHLPDYNAFTVLSRKLGWGGR